VSKCKIIIYISLINTLLQIKLLADTSRGEYFTKISPLSFGIILRVVMDTWHPPQKNKGISMKNI